MKTRVVTVQTAFTVATHVLERTIRLARMKAKKALKKQSTYLRTSDHSPDYTI